MSGGMSALEVGRFLLAPTTGPQGIEAFKLLLQGGFPAEGMPMHCVCAALYSFACVVRRSCIREECSVLLTCSAMKWQGYRV